MDTMALCKQIVDPFYRRRERVEDYIVRVDLAPNPLNYDGMNEAQAQVVRRDRDRTSPWVPGQVPTYSERVVLGGGHAGTLEEALTKLATAAGALV